MCEHQRMSLVVCVMRFIYPTLHPSIQRNGNRMQKALLSHPGTVQENLLTMWCADSYNTSSQAGKEDVWFMVSCSAQWLLSFLTAVSAFEDQNNKNQKHMAWWKNTKMTCCALLIQLQKRICIQMTEFIYWISGIGYCRWLEAGEWGNPLLNVQHAGTEVIDGRNCQKHLTF